jgi:hypothetical protein
LGYLKDKTILQLLAPDSWLLTPDS